MKDFFFGITEPHRSDIKEPRDIQLLGSVFKFD